MFLKIVAAANVPLPFIINSACLDFGCQSLPLAQARVQVKGPFDKCRYDRGSLISVSW